MRRAEENEVWGVDGYLFLLENAFFLTKTVVQMFSSKLFFHFSGMKFVSVLITQSLVLLNP